MRVEITEGARNDLAEGVRFYEKQAPGLGDYFLRSLLREIASLAASAGVHARVLGYHRLLSKRFRHAVYYEVEGDNARVYAVLDCRRDPSWIRKRLS